jgi:mannose-6-phosphate isomerase-like protein (cupin superfamily)
MGKSSKPKSARVGNLTRRSLLAGTALGSLAAMTAFKRAHGLEASGARPSTSKPANRPNGHRMEREHENLIHYANVHEGKGTIDIKAFFRADGYAKPALLLIYSMPPGSSEGVHTHRPGDEKLGSFDEFYYIIEGRGAMEIAGEKVPVSAGDHVFTPNGVAHGIENTSDSLLKVYLVAMIRD